MGVVTARELSDLLPGVDPRLIAQHVDRLDSRYFQRFDASEIARHVEGLATLGAGRAVSVQVDDLPGGEIRCTVLAFDHPGAFSLIAGILSSLGFDIRSGDIFTWEPPAREAPRSLELRRRRIVDCFTGGVQHADRSEGWSELLAARLQEAFAGLEKGGEAAAAARRAVNELAASTLGRLRLAREPVLYPVHIDVGPTDTGRTRMLVISQDTPFFLFTFSAALTLQDVSIEHVTIRTEGDRIEDEFEFLDAGGSAIGDPGRIDRIKMSVLLTKQFTTFLESAPDPLAALTRFEQLVRDVIVAPRQGKWVELLSDQDVLRDLAQLLGASTYLWEDFVRLQYEELLPMLAPHTADQGFCEPPETLRGRLGTALEGVEDTEEFTRVLNEFKDREIYLFDLDHILRTQRGAGGEFGTEFLTLSRRLTALAEAVVGAAASHARRALADRFGEPRTVAGLPVPYALLGLGKMGGAALGYASDIEILVVYGDNGATEGPQSIDNAEFFDRMVREIVQLVRAKREGIFHVDIRLRPYGAAGPLGCSLESFCTYYAPGGPAHSYERLSLVRLRSIGGDTALGSQVERLRDEMVYSAQSIDLAELRELRARQVQEKTSPGGLNAKFSPGALVDLEYAVQILQVIHGAAEPRLRTPRIHEALEALASVGVVERAEAEELVAAYRFFRQLINGLRMLRGSAQDLVLPGLDSAEYGHLARRTGYLPDRDIAPAQKLHLDFEAHSAAVRTFVERHFGRDSLPGAPVVTAADLVLSDRVPEALAREALAQRGFADPGRALDNLRRIGGEAEQRMLFARLAILASDVLVHRPDPDMALNNWERYIHALPDARAHLRQALSQPMRLEIMLKLFSASQFLADTLVREPGLLDELARPEVIHAHRTGAMIASELGEISAGTDDREQWRDSLRRFRRGELLRIGARDMCLGIPTPRIMEEISDLADGFVSASLERLRAKGKRGPGFCVIAFGKLGGRELNYSSDIDLLGLSETGADHDTVENHTAWMEGLRADLSAHTTEGYAYRVDLRLRPYGSSGQLVFPLSSLLDYYRTSAALWELQALLKARPIAGDPDVGAAFMSAVRELLLAPREKSAVAASIDKLRREALRGLSRSVLSTTDIKTGLGGLRDVEFLTQGLQLVHAHRFPGLLCGGTLPGLRALADAEILPGETVERLSEDYIFLRRVEHFLQIYEDRQTHSLPRDPSQLRAISRLMLGPGATSEQFLSELGRRFERVQAEYRAFMGE